MQTKRLRTVMTGAAAVLVAATLATPWQGALAAGPAPQQPPPAPALTIYRVPTGSEQDRQKLLASGLDVIEKREGDDLFVLGNDASQSRLRQLGFASTVDEVLKIPRWTPPRKTDDTYYGGYKTVNGRYAHMDQVAQAHPDMAKTLTYGQSWRKSNGLPNGYDLRAICVTKMADGDCELNPDSKKPRFFLMSQIHAREIATGETASRWIDHLVTQYGKDERITKLMDTTEMWVVPVANPDGVDIVQQGGDQPLMQRKNGNNSIKDCGDPHSGVDLNRNADSHWGGAGTTKDPCGETYLGPKAGSEIENVALFDMLAKLYPDRREGDDSTPAPADTRGMFMSLHSVAGMVLFPWQFDASHKTGNDAQLRHHGAEMGKLTGYQSGQAGEILYNASGGTDDWAYDKLGVASYTIEVGDYPGSCGGFLPEFSCNDSHIWPGMLPALMYAAEHTAAPYQQ